MFNLINILSFLAFTFVIIGLRGIKWHRDYGQKFMFAAQIFWIIIGYMQNNYFLIGQSLYLSWFAWSTHKLWKKEGYYEF